MTDHSETNQSENKYDGNYIDPEATPDERLWATLMHLTMLLPGLSIIPLLVIWLIKKNDSYFIDDHGREALNFQISMFVWYVVAGILTFCIIGIFLAPALAIFGMIICIINAIRANQGQYVRYPITIRFLN